MTANDIIALAKSQLGISEDPPGSNNIKYNTEYYGGPSNLPWCVVFIWWLFKELGASSLFCGGNKTAWCDYVRDWAISHNQWVTGDYKPGDLVLFQWDDGNLDHIGLVISVNGNSVTTIEGNCGDKVSQMQRSGIAMVGAYRPKYDGYVPDLKPIPSEPENQPVNNPSEYIVKDGDTLWDIAEKCFGVGKGWRYTEIKEANGLVSDTIYAGQRLIIPNGKEGMPAEDLFVTISATITKDTYHILKTMADGWNKTIGEVIGEVVNAL